MASEDIIGAREVAKVLKIHVRTVTRLAERGELKGFRVGDLWRFRRSALDEYIAEQERKQQQREKEQEQTKEKEGDV